MPTMGKGLPFPETNNDANSLSVMEIRKGAALVAVHGMTPARSASEGGRNGGRPWRSAPSLALRAGVASVKMGASNGYPPGIAAYCMRPSATTPRAPPP